MTSIFDLASGIWADDLNEPCSPTILSISGWVANNLGEVNILLNTEFCRSGAYVVPEMGNTEKSILRHVYFVNKFYDQQINKVSLGISSPSGIDWIEIREGDSVVRRNNKTELIKSLSTMKKDVGERLDKLVTYYRSNTNIPYHVEGRIPYAVSTD